MKYEFLLILLNRNSSNVGLFGTTPFFISTRYKDPSLTNKMSTSFLSISFLGYPIVMLYSLALVV
ncbi:MAG: hypothetical protein IJU92_04435 [Spirochaetaceae bacterium]|nr:hypothetical protein [Spirochaetaceae bacterium]